MSIKRYILCIFLISILCSNTSLKTDESIPIEERYVGIWTVHWANDPQKNVSNIDYVDTFKIELNSTGKLSISCINYEYFVFSKIKPKESSIKFLVENTEDPTEKFFIQYTLHRENENLLKGKILNSQGQRDHITLKRIK